MTTEALHHLTTLTGPPKRGDEIESTGHADLIRESIDGLVGEGIPAGL